MPGERQYYNWEDWMADGGPATGQPEPPRPQPSVDPYQPPTPPTAPATPPPTTGGGRHPNAGPDGSTQPNMDQPGYRGGYWMNGQWVGGSPYGGTTELPGPDPYTFGGDLGAEPPPFNWSQFNPTPFSSKIGMYTPTTMAEADSDPGYQFSRNQGREVLENSAAGRGVLRTGGTLKNILEYGNRFAEQNYQSVDNRRFRNWGANVDNEFRTHDVNYRGEKDAFGFRHDTEKLNFADLYSRWRDRLNSLTQIATAGPDT